MKDMTLTQSYFVCAVGRRGQLSGLSVERQVCLLGAGLLELALAGCITLGKNTAAVCAPLPVGCACLHPLYSDLDCGKPVKIEKLLEEYTYSLSSDRRLNALTGAVGNALVSAGLAREARGGLFGGKTRYIPQDEAINRVVDMMRAELLEEGEYSDEAAALGVLLDKGNCMKEYFSKFEQRQLRGRLRTLSQTEAGRRVQQMMDYVYNMIAVSTALIAVYH